MYDRIQIIEAVGGTCVALVDSSAGLGRRIAGPKPTGSVVSRYPLDRSSLAEALGLEIDLVGERPVCIAHGASNVLMTGESGNGQRRYECQRCGASTWSRSTGPHSGEEYAHAD